MKKAEKIIIAVLFAIFVGGNIGTAEASSWHSDIKNIQRHAENKFKGTIKKVFNREADRFINLLDPNSRESRELSAKQTLYSLPYGETIILATGSRASALKKAIKELALFDYVGPAKTAYGKTVGIRVYRYASIEEAVVP